MRAQEEIVAQCEARVRELEAQAEDNRARVTPDPEKPFCSTCKWLVWPTTGSCLYFARCHEPLIKGFGEAPYIYDAPDGSGRRDCALCGPEKALWQPRPSNMRRLSPYLALGSMVTTCVLGVTYGLFGGVGLFVLFVLTLFVLATFAVWLAGQ